jgi:hypothetical protein
MKQIDLNPEIWGSKGWFFIDSIILSYPNNPSKEIKNDFLNFLTLLKKMLPCENCRKHYDEFIKINPLTEKILESRENLIIWILNLHNNINKLNEKKIITLEEFSDYYNKKYTDKCDKKCNTNINNNNNNIIKLTKCDSYLYDSLNSDYIKQGLILILLLAIIFIHKKNKY